ncbi:TetR family transcriptional regulator [Devosia riboflavina]|uniref:TetR family transcriptional regulator n=1 Tax=Devosia riboflavina TaxID=46914 RepID=A0A087M6B2_9HYPH|nr:TetR/AcrR family transcriptional regulator [Devosia riboflavina]KFL32415.1 TetR family transcriptional regulator [Devosia riboflavina]
MDTTDGSSGANAGGQGATQRKTLSRETWLEAARKVLERRGISAVKIDALARQLKVTRGSFYFHFAGLSDLHAGLIDIWRQRNCAPFEALKQASIEGQVLFETVVRVWVDEKTFVPSLDLAIRDWARSSRILATEVETTDRLRLDLLTRAFRGMGYSDDESVVRARITYLHQIGYYAIGFKEPAADRKRYQPIYGRVLEGPLSQ